MTAKFGLLIDAKTKGENNIKRLGNSMQGVEGKAKNLGMAVKGVGLAFKALFAAAAVGGFSAVVKGAIDSADAFGKLSTRTGIAADKLQAFANAGKLADVSQSDLEAGLRTLARTQAEAADGVATYADAYAKLGVSVKKADGSLKPSDQLLGEIAGKFQDLPNGPEKAAVAMDIFGRSGSKLITLLNGGTEALERFNYETSENFAQNAEYFNDQITILQIQFDGFRKQLADALLPALNAIIEVFQDLFDSKADFSALFTVVDAGVRGIAFAVLGVVKAIDELVRLLQTAFKIVNAARQLDFDEVGRLGQEYGAGVAGRFQTSREQFNKVLFGTSEVGADYGGGGIGTLGQLDQDGSRGGKAKGARKQKEVVQMSQVEFNLRQAIRDARKDENEIALINAEFALEQFDIGNKFNNDVLGARNALLDAELDRNLALQGIEDQRAAAARQAAEEARAAAQARLEADPGYQMKQQLEELVKLENQVAAGATAIGNAFTNSVRSIITGSKSAEQALGDMLAAVAEHFMEMAAKIIAQQLAMILYQTILNALGGPRLGGEAGPGGYRIPEAAAPKANIPRTGYAEGGFVTSPTNALIGEGGEPEYVIPQSKMQESMARFSAGARGSSVIPANGGGSGDYGGAMGGGTVVNYNGPTLNFNSEDYVPASAVPRIIDEAAKRGAKAGESRTFASLQNSRSRRSRVGLGS